MNHAAKSFFGYSSRPSYRGRILLALLLAGVAFLVGAALTVARMDMLKVAFERFRLARRCAEFPGGSFVVYEEDPKAAEALTQSSSQYCRVFAGQRAPARAAFEPWVQMCDHLHRPDLAPACLVATLRSPVGVEYLVALYLPLDQGYCAGFAERQPMVAVVDPGSLLREPRIVNVELPSTKIPTIASESLRVKSGSRDPSNPARRLIPYSTASGRGSLCLELRSDGTVRVSIIDGPAARALEALDANADHKAMQILDALAPPAPPVPATPRRYP